MSPFFALLLLSLLLSAGFGALVAGTVWVMWQLGVILWEAWRDR